MFNVRRWLRRRPEPEAPRNLRAIYRDGRVVPLDLVYAGRRKGLDIWTTPHEYDLTGVDTVALEYLPPRTGIDFVGHAEPGSMFRLTRDGDSG